MLFLVILPPDYEYGVNMLAFCKNAAKNKKKIFVLILNVFINQWSESELETEWTARKLVWTRNFLKLSKIIQKQLGKVFEDSYYEC